MPSIRAIRPGHHPFPFLLYGEWVLVGIALMSEFSPNLLPRSGGFPAAALMVILGFGALGLWLPTRPLGLKIAHVVLQFSLIVLAARLSTLGLRLFPLLQVVLVLRSCLLFDRWGRLLITSVTFVFFLGMAQHRLQSLDRALPPRLGGRLMSQLIGIRLNLVVMFLLLLVFLLLLMNALISERERREELRQANQKLRESAAQIEKLAMNQERTRIAREIHDSLGHALTGLNIQLEGALKLWDANPEQARAFVTQAKEMGSTALQETRQAVATLRQPPLWQQDLATAIAPLTQRLQQVTGVVPDMVVDCPHLPESLKLTVYRIVQEALTNVCKYAQATQVSIAIQPLPDASRLTITIQDNGVGFNPQDNTTGFGLRGIQERAKAEGGQVQLTSAPGQGCILTVWLPLPLEVA
ncbi:sensor histidine kinase [Nodosilinea sp. LEGE 07088]|uniref:sensor histidine kinase n=1 Tax=Nodosilinea sp. LEGE 07088 TaxID=2777968 RepID=UPI001880830D|nr:sensor histidine kinase [Nodosilinea sp. LEGE 07088]MBE9141399.1 sensor histidine kinase [Nodosilinea sp. LEGE 07088]